MNTRLWLFLFCFWWASSPLASRADTAADFLERFPTGSINWTRGVVTASGSAPLSADKALSGPDASYDQARLKAVRNLKSTLQRLRLNHQGCIVDLLSTRTYIRDQLDALTSAAYTLHTERSTDGGVEVTLGINFYGGFSQLMLPQEVRQVESIKPLNAVVAAVEDDGRTVGVVDSRPAVAPDAYTGLVVDARGIGAAPSLVPVLVDESGSEVYGPAYVSREFAVQRGMCQYVRGKSEVDDMPRVAPRPLHAKGLNALPDNSCYIVISNSDASRLRSASCHLEFLKQCCVVILLD